MKIIVIGAGASGVSAAIHLKRNNPNDDVLIIEHLDKPLKKILATGNGKCNLGNDKINYSLFNNPEFAKNVIDGYDYKSFFESINIKTKLIGDLAYPVSESAVSVREALLNELKKLNVEIHTEEQLINYKVDNQIFVTTNKTEYVCDKLILAGGLTSSPKLGSDGSVFNILLNHGYRFEKLVPGLSPLYTVEKTKIIDGIRVKSNVKLFVDNKLISEENGEVLFKDHGLSGIVIFNMMSRIANAKGKRAKLFLDLLPEYDENELKTFLKTHSLEEMLLAFINPKIADYLKERFTKPADIINSVKNLEFTFDKSYGYDFSQVTVGGISTNEVNNELMSIREENVYLIGELLNIDGPCGGYNLTFAFASGSKIK